MAKRLPAQQARREPSLGRLGHSAEKAQLEISSQQSTFNRLPQDRMQNSRMIRRVNASLARCLSHHRRLCRDIDELDRLLFNDEFLRDPRTQWLLQSRQREAEGMDMELKRSQVRLLLSPAQEALSGSSSDSEGGYQGTRRNSTFRQPRNTSEKSLPRC